MRRLTWILIVSALAAAACRGVSSETPTPERCGRSDAKGCLVVVQTMAEDPVYIEGSMSYVRVTDSSGTVFETDLRGTGLRRVLDAALEPGMYVLLSYQRSCDGNCGDLDPPSDRCSTDFEIKAGAQATIRIALRPGHGCTATARF